VDYRKRLEEDGGDIESMKGKLTRRPRDLNTFV